MVSLDRMININSTPDELEKIRVFIDRIARELGYPEAAIFEIELSLYEACANVIEHAYGNEPGHNIQIMVEEDVGQMVITIKDWGDGFDSSAKRPKVDINRFISTKQDGGLGLHIINACVDETTYQRYGNLNIFKLIKDIPVQTTVVESK